MDFESYVRDARPRLLRLATVLTDDPHLGQDLVSEVLLKAHQRWGRIGRVDDPHAYVRRMVANEAVSWHRKWGRVQPLPADQLDSELADPTTAVDGRDELLRGVAALPPKQRAAVVLRYFEDLPDTEIAEALGCSPSTVRVHIHRALTTLRVRHDADAFTEGHTHVHRG